jgi:hypothetical protein
MLLDAHVIREGDDAQDLRIIYAVEMCPWIELALKGE